MAHTTTDEQLVVFRGKCPLCVFIKSKPGKYGIKFWVAADGKNFYTCSMQVYTGKSGGVREKKQGLRVYGTRRDVTTDNFFTSCELANFLLSKNITVVGTLRKNKPEIPAFFCVGKQRNVYSSLWFYCDLTLIICTIKKQDCQPPFITSS